ncbi:MAG: [glutamine synthetase] adenylyltransferase / [glutamine synthetase]-adenylyl-L-tyrosine [Frankiaceae bacterium]|nr:[glutamine synthetase] adenylyltransferase / [glutamine synthetase]-adenylyl-L-tyrosine [Frankiaceae bacterium]
MTPLSRRDTSAARLLRLGFADPDRADAAIDAAGLTSYDLIVGACGDAADPDRALAHLVAILAAVPDRDATLADLEVDEDYRSRLLAVIGASDALAEHLLRHPEDLAVLADAELAATRPSAYGLTHELLTAVGADPADPPTGSGGSCATVPDAAIALRLAYRRRMLALAARDLTGQTALDDVAAELADLASATLTAALAVARTSVTGTAHCRLAVIGMGKTGGRELNYVSDVDVIFVAEPINGSDETAALAVATELAAGMMRVCSANTVEGTLWTVDANLRPEGRNGPLVRTLDSHLAYYRRWARTWEFQALLKARHVAGDHGLAQRYLDGTRPMVWTAAERENFVPDVQAMRRRVEDNIPKSEADRELKLGPGGLRDVEFSVQLLQLVHGRGDDSIRSPNTLEALASLVAGGYVGRSDAAELAEAYRWLRTVEHRLQVQRMRRTHTIPADAETRRWLARAVGYRGDAVAAFDADRDRYAREVRRIQQKLFYRPLLAAVARLSATDSRLTPEAAQARLEALGFADPAGALRHLEALTAGVTRRAAIQRTLLPAMLGWFADAANPDAGLLAFRQVSDALGATPWYLRLLRDEGATAERLARVLATSRYVVELLIRAPEGVTVLGGEDALVPMSRAALDETLGAIVERTDDWHNAVLAARGIRRHEVLRVASADLLGFLDVRGVGRALADIAGATIAAALRTAERKVERERGAPLPMRIAVIAMGRLGGCEQGYGSDADVLFVHEPLEGASDEEAVSVAQTVAEEMRALLAVPAPDPALRVDADLRPEGRQGPLVRSFSSYAAYYERWSEIWEAQALTRAAPLAGDEELTARFLGLVDPIRYPAAGLTDAHVKEIRRIKARVEAERLPRGADPATHTKLGRGGLADVEWTVQLLQLQHAHEVPSLRTPNTLSTLDALAAAGLLTADDAAALAAAWSLATRVRNAIMLVRGRAGDSLPTDTRELAAVSRAVGFPAGATGAFVEHYRKTTRRARAVVERVFFG